MSKSDFQHDPLCMTSAAVHAPGQTASLTRETKKPALKMLSASELNFGHIRALYTNEFDPDRRGPVVSLFPNGQLTIGRKLIVSPMTAPIHYVCGLCFRKGLNGERIMRMSVWQSGITVRFIATDVESWWDLP